MNQELLSRRRVLSSVATVSVIGLAGCTTESEEPASAVDKSVYLKSVETDDEGACTALNSSGCVIRVLLTEKGLSEVSRIVFIREGAEVDEAETPEFGDSVLLDRGFSVETGELVLVGADGEELERVPFDLE